MIAAVFFYELRTASIAASLRGPWERFARHAAHLAHGQQIQSALEQPPQQLPPRKSIC